MDLVTIVVPFYNVERYIGECLQSLVRQTYHAIEILCIDDCSPDGSIEVVREYARRDDRIRIISHEKNKGLGGARNTGISHASGRYICFIDSDDYISHRFVELLYGAISKDSSDIAVCNIWQSLDGEIRPYETRYVDGRHKIRETGDNVLDVAGRINPGCTNKLYKLELIRANGLVQPEKRYYEGVEFWLMCVYYSSAISTISDRLYYYRQRSGSIMQSHSFSHINDRFDFIRGIDRFVKSTILNTPGIDQRSLLDDTLKYLLRHIHYGKRLVAESANSNREEMDGYYDDQIKRFSIQCGWPDLALDYEMFRKNRLLINKTNTKNATVDELGRKLQDETDRTVSSNKEIEKKT